MGLATELVPTVGQPIRPGQQRLPSTSVGHAVRGVAVDDVLTAYLVRAEPSANFHDDGSLAAVRDLELPARRGSDCH
jgi:hypothetical protein